MAEHATTDVTRRTVLRAGGVAGATVGAAVLAGCANSGTSNLPKTRAAAGVIVPLDDVPIGGVKAVTINRVPAFVARPDADTVRAFSAVCTHQGCTVVAAGSTLLCPCHGSNFEPLTGAVTKGPAETDLPALEVHIDGDSVVAGS